LAPAPRYRRGHFEFEMPTTPTPASASSQAETPARTWLASLLSSLLGLCALVGVALLGLACAKDSAHATSAPGGYVDESDYYEGGEDHYAEAEIAREYGSQAMGGGLSSRGARTMSKKIESRRDFSDRDTAAPAQRTEPTSAATPEPVDALEAEPPPSTPASSPTPATHKRQIIYTATMQVRVFDVEHAIAVAEALPERLGGWLHQRSDTQLILRIPAERLEQAMAEIAELGIVDYRLLEALDVTAQYTDLDSRIRVLEQIQTQLEALLARAEDVEQALEIRRALDAVTLELEAARAHMRELAKSIAFSTLVLRLIEQGPDTPTPSSNDPFGWVDQLGVEATEYR
jgi:chemotaxis protein histidine kinase CheA